MPQQARSADAALEEPMAVDGGASGLQNSRHHPNAGTSALNAQAPPKSDDKTTAEDKITAFEKTIASLIEEGRRGGIPEEAVALVEQIRRDTADHCRGILKVTAIQQCRSSTPRQKTNKSYAKLCRDVKDIKNTL